MLCVPGYGSMQYAVYVFMLVDMLCYVQSVSSGLRSDAGDKVPVSSGLRSNAVSSGLWSDAGGKAPVSPNFGPMQGTRS